MARACNKLKGKKCQNVKTKFQIDIILNISRLNYKMKTLLMLLYETLNSYLNGDPEKHLKVN